MRKVLLALLFAMALVVVVACWYVFVHGRSGTYYHPPERTQTSGCVIVHALPDPRCTPGGVDPTATKDAICSRSTKEVRHVTESVERAVFFSYGVSRGDGVARENDHVISLELGGDNSIANLFPQVYEDKAKLEAEELLDDELGAHAKDKVENWLHARVCHDELELADAQRMIATNWVAVYHAYIAYHHEHPVRRRK